ncbi:MAG TPA: tetratricopeptide repeat protein [Candidatus Polarisedimenticolaceae bacterium]|nr:tetratricopeptide repeat protein [Candidatus Polarisedimenticolaceae bacterium]
MPAERVLLAGLLAIALLSRGSPALGAPDPQAAQEAFEAGDTERALALFDEILAANPSDVNALLRSGMLLSWSRRFDDALARYDRALAVEPANAKVLLERGKVFLWSRRYDEAIESFDKVLRIDPKEPWALCGTAQAYAWSGRSGQARPYYERALAAQPDFKEAELGLAYLELEDGDSSAAQDRSKRLSAAYPDDRDVADLAAQVRRARAPWIQIGWDRSSDSDDIRMNTYRLEGGLALPARLDARFGVAHSDLRGPSAGGAGESADAESLYAVLGWTPSRRHRGEARLGVTRLTDPSDRERTTGTGGVSYAFPIGRWDARASVARDPLLYSPEILDNDIDITTLAFGAWGMAAPHVRVETNASYGDFSDGNARVGLDAGGWYVWRWSRRSLMAGGIARYLDYSDDLDHGYFDPQGLNAVLASLRSDGTIGASRWEYEASGEAGVQSYTFDGDDASGKALWNLYAFAARPLSRSLTFQAYAGVGNSSTASGPGFNARTFGVRFRWALGG